MLFTHRNPEMQLDYKRTALVVVDMQNEFFEEKSGTLERSIPTATKKMLIDTLHALE